MKKFLETNLNNRIKFKPNEAGIRLLVEDINNYLRPTQQRITPQIFSGVLDSKGFYEMQLHFFMSVFGEFSSNLHEYLEMDVEIEVETEDESLETTSDFIKCVAFDEVTVTVKRENSLKSKIKSIKNASEVSVKSKLLEELGYLMVSDKKEEYPSIYRATIRTKTYVAAMDREISDVGVQIKTKLALDMLKRDAK